MLLSSNQVSELMEDEALMFSMSASLQVDREATSGELPAFCEFPEVFPDDISDLPPEHERSFLYM